MTPEDLDPDRSEEELSPEDGETVRRLLAAAADPMTMPSDVAGRLDEMLAGLQAERGATSSGTHSGSAVRPASVTGLSERRSRRWPKVLVAAAAVAVVGVGLGNILANTGGDPMGAATSTDAPNAGAGGAGEAAPSPGSADDLARSDDKTAPRPQKREAQLDAAPTSALPRVRTGSVTLDAQRIHDLSLGFAAPRGTTSGGARSDADALACDLPAFTRGERLVAVRLDGERATLLFRAREDGHRQAEVYSCDDSGSPVLGTTVDAP